MNTEIEVLKNIITGLRENNNTYCTCKCISARDFEQIYNGRILETLQNHQDNTYHQKYTKLSETIDARIAKSNKNNNLLQLDIKQTRLKIASMETENAASLDAQRQIKEAIIKNEQSIT